jgi:hypothetical protein
MDTNKTSKQELQYKPKGKKCKKRWQDHIHIKDEETGTKPNLSGLMMMMIR